MFDSGFFFTAWDESDPEARDENDYLDAADSLLTQEPPAEDGALPGCPACGGLGGKCCEVSAMERRQEVMA